MTTGAEILNLARKHLSEKYRNVQVPKDDQNWNGPWDCAEFASWLIYQTSGILFGCTDPNARPAKADAYTGAWRTDANKRGRMVSVEEAAATPGAVLLRYPPPGKQMGHIAISDGEGGTVEAMDQRHGVTTGRVSGRRWDTGVLVPGIAYVRNARVVPVKAPSMLYAEDAPNMNPEVVRRIQNALAEKGFPTRDAAGRFAEGTTDAVLDFQADRGIVADGQIGPNTAERLGISLSDVTTPVAAAVLRGVVGTNPLVAVATAIFPAIARVIAGDQSGKVAASAAQAIAEMTGAADPDKARAQIDANPGLQAALQIRLAEIANAQEQSRIDAEADARRDDMAAEIQRRDNELRELQTRLGDVEKAREFSLDLARIGGPSSNGPTYISYIVAVGFFALLASFVFMLTNTKYDPNNPYQFDPTFLQIVNVCIGALTVAFSTVVTFWLGSSEGSRRKDVIAATMSDQQATNDRKAVLESTGIMKDIVDKAANRPVAPARPVTTRSAVSNFTNCLNAIFEREGGFSNDPNDRGGPTNFGITQDTLSAARGHPVAEADVKRLTRTEARDIYRSLFWNRLRCDDLPPGVDLMVFDLGVHSGPGRAAQLLQKVVSAEQDGSIGNLTINACRNMQPRAIIEEFHRLKMARYSTLPDWKHYAQGWSNRADEILKTALAMSDPQVAAA